MANTSTTHFFAALRHAFDDKTLWRRHLWIFPAFIFVLAAIGSLSPNSYFLHFDTPTQVTAAQDMVKGCWGEVSASLAPIFLLLLPFALFGSDPVWEMVILTLLGFMMVGAFHRMLAQLTGSSRWALVGSLWFLSLPTILYYTRIHIGYPLAFYTFGIMLCIDRRWLWAGLALGLAILSHFNYSVGVIFWLFWLLLLDAQRERISAALKLAAGMVGVILFFEAIEFLYNAYMLGWLRAVAEEGARLSNSLQGTERWPITHLLNLVAFSNGWPSAILLVTGIAYPVVRKPRIPVMDAIYLTGWGIFGGYSLRVSLGNTFLTPRMFSAAYPLLAICAIFTLMRLVARASKYAQVRSLRLEQAVPGALSILIAVGLISNTTYTAQTARTGYEDIEQVMRRAADANLPVRYFGNFHVAYFYGSLFSRELSINETSMDLITSDQRAVLVFESSEHSTQLRALRTALGAEIDDYEITSSPHLYWYVPALVEDYGISPDVLHGLRETIASTRRDASRSSIEVWWPTAPDGTFQARESRQDLIFYYSGSGCTARQTYPDGTKYYEILLDKAATVWDEILQGNFKGVVDLLWKWITE